jgi:hypothetical protein
VPDHETHSAPGRQELTVNVYPTRKNSAARLLFEQYAARRGDSPQRSPLRRVAKAELLPYQLDGIAFAASAGTALCRRDGTFKTIKLSEWRSALAREASKVLVVCPAR